MFPDPTNHTSMDMWTFKIQKFVSIDIITRLNIYYNDEKNYRLNIVINFMAVIYNTEIKTTQYIDCVRFLLNAIVSSQVIGNWNGKTCRTRANEVRLVIIF